jgi:PAS domain S-box-containing protein
VDAWRAGVRAAPGVVSLVALPATRFIALSPAAEQMFGQPVGEGVGLDYLDIVEPKETVVTTAALMISGGIDMVQGRRRLRRPDGSWIDLDVRAWAVRSTSGNDLALWTAVDAATAENAWSAVGVAAEAGISGVLTSGDEVQLMSAGAVSLDTRWRVSGREGDVDTLLGLPGDSLIGRWIVEIVHPADVASLLSLFARATEIAGADANIRFRRRDGSWRWLSVAVSLSVSGKDTLFNLNLTEPWGGPNPRRVDDLERHLLRIASELRSAGVLVEVQHGVGVVTLPTLMQLSVRQREIVGRLARGQRVPEIAREMYVSQSTVRNHLSVVFRKLGVGSQGELIALLRTAQHQGLAADPAD